MSAAVINAEYPLGGVPLSAEARLNNLSVTPAAGNGATSFTVTGPAIGPGSVLLNIFPGNAAAVEVVGAVGAISMSGSGTTATGTLTVTFPAADLLGTEIFIIQILSQP